MDTSIDIDVYISPYCDHCRTALRHLTTIGEHIDRPFAIRERNILEHLDSAVAAGVRATPAVVINGRLLSSGGTTRARLERVLLTFLDTEKAHGNID